MKNLIASLAFMLTVTSFAQDGPNYQPGPVVEITEAHEIVRAMIQNPEIGEKLRESYLTEVFKMTKQGLRPGVTEYKVSVSTCGNCIPKFGLVTILEDMRSTYADGPIDYQINITVGE